MIEAYQTDNEMIIHTLEGDHHASVGDYIITGVKGEQYPCKPDILKQPMRRLNRSVYKQGIGRHGLFEKSRCGKMGKYLIGLEYTKGQHSL